MVTRNMYRMFYGIIKNNPLYRGSASILRYWQVMKKIINNAYLLCTLNTIAVHCEKSVYST